MSFRTFRLLLLTSLPLCFLTTVAPAALLNGAKLTTVDPAAFASNDINVVANARNSVVSYGKYQYVAYYAVDPANATTSAPYAVYVARRDTTDPNSQFVPVKMPSANRLTAAQISDDHRAISIAIDNGGFLHVSYGMHASARFYFVTNRSAAVATWPNFSSAASYTSYTTFGGLNAAVTYPEFTRIPTSNDLLYTYRDGGSGSGDMYLTRATYTPGGAKTFTFTTPTKLISGTAPGTANVVSAYTNNMVYAHNGDLMMSWVWRETPGYQSNHDILFAKSHDNGVTWTDVAGNVLATPLTVYDAATNPAGTQPAIVIPTGNSLINTTTMAVDSQNRPMIATWYAPGHAAGDDTRQYMLDYYDGLQWLHSQITQRPAESLTTDDDVREMGRPLVLVDKQDRVLVVMRYRNDAGSDPNASNQLVVAYSSDKKNWKFVTLDSDDVGNFEPASYDQDLWNSQNKLSLLYQQTDASLTTSPISLLEWDAAAFFAAVPEPTSLAACGVALPLVLRRRR